MLAKELARRGYKVSVWDFPDYSTPLGRQLKTYLAGRNPLDYHVAHLLYAANRWERAEELEREIKRGRNIIVNRYTQSNLAYGVAHGLPLRWLNSLEKNLRKPDMVIVLDIEPRTSFRRKMRRRDVHENDPIYLRKVRNAYVNLARRNGWKVINAQLDPNTVHSELLIEVNRLIRGK